MRILIIISSFLFLLTSCNTESALKYSEDVVALQRQLIDSVNEAQPQVGHYMKEGLMDSLAIISQQMETVAANKLAEVEQLPLPNVKGGEAFQRASLLYFSHVRNIYASYKSYGKAQGDSSREQERQKMIRLETELEAVVAKMQKAQQELAKANGFRLENK
jgi:hypothetical protein